MAGEAGDRRFWTVVFLASVDFCCVLLALERWDKGDLIVGSVWLVAGVVFSVVGFKWPAIRQRIPFARRSGSQQAVVPVAEAPVGVADVVIEYSHDDRDRSVPPRGSRPLLLKNVTAGKNALNVRVKPVEAHDKLVFRPDIVTCIVGGGQEEVVPECESMKARARFRLNELPDFLNGFYNRDGHIDKDALDELYQEKSLWLEVDYESEGKPIVAECELLYIRWHEQIRTGQHRIRLADADQAPSVRQIKIPKEVWQEQLRDSRAAIREQATAMVADNIGRTDWLQLKKDFDECPRDIRADYSRNGKPPEDRWSIGGTPRPDRCRALCQLAGSMLLRSPTVRFGLSEEIRSISDPTYRWLYFLKERRSLENFMVGYEEIDRAEDGGILRHH